MLDNIVYFSGVHGSGKSTLICEIAKHQDFIAHKRIHSVTLDDTYVRAVWRLTKYYIETTEQLALAQTNSDKVILGNRCVYDNFAYMNAFEKLGWISEKQNQHHSDIFEALFSEDLRPKKIIYISPPIEWIKERLSERWQIKGKKWREDNFDYLSAVTNEYHNFYYASQIHILRLKETNYQKRIDLVLDWLKKQK